MGQGAATWVRPSVGAHLQVTMVACSDHSGNSTEPSPPLLSSSLWFHAALFALGPHFSRESVLPQPARCRSCLLGVFLR